MAQFNQNVTLVGLSSLNTVITAAGSYTCAGKISVPQISTGSTPSAVVATVFQNSSPIYTGIAGAEGFSVPIVCAAGDVIGVAFTSSNSVDAALNAVKSVISIG